MGTQSRDPANSKTISEENMESKQALLAVLLHFYPRTWAFHQGR